MLIRNISDHTLIIARGPFSSLAVEPDEAVEVPDEDADAHCWRVEGIPGVYDGLPEETPGEKYRRVPSDLWVEAGAPVPEPVPAEEPS